MQVFISIQIAVVASGRETRVPPGKRDRGTDCFSSKLARGIEANKDHIKRFVKSISSSGPAQISYIQAFSKAFSYFKPDTWGGVYS